MNPLVRGLRCGSFHQWSHWHWADKQIKKVDQQALPHYSTLPRLLCYKTSAHRFFQTIVKLIHLHQRRTCLKKEVRVVYQIKSGNASEILIKIFLQIFLQTFLLDLTAIPTNTKTTQIVSNNSTTDFWLSKTKTNTNTNNNSNKSIKSTPAKHHIWIIHYSTIGSKANGKLLTADCKKTRT